MTASIVPSPLSLNYEGDYLNALWMPNGEMALTLWMSGDSDKASMVMLNIEQAKELDMALDPGDPGISTEIFSVRPANRGEPYREGLSLTLPPTPDQEPYEFGESIFLDEFAIPELREKLQQGIKVFEPKPEPEEMGPGF
jgi:hypothetical protein